MCVRMGVLVQRTRNVERRLRRVSSGGREACSDTSAVPTVFGSGCDKRRATQWRSLIRADKGAVAAQPEAVTALIRAAPRAHYASHMLCKLAERRLLRASGCRAMLSGGNQRIDSASEMWAAKTIKAVKSHRLVARQTGKHIRATYHTATDTQQRCVCMRRWYSLYVGQERLAEQMGRGQSNSGRIERAVRFNRSTQQPNSRGSTADTTALSSSLTRLPANSRRAVASTTGDDAGHATPRHAATRRAAPTAVAQHEAHTGHE